MYRDIRFPEPERMNLGRNGYMRTTGVSLTMTSGVVEIEPWTSKDRVGRARIVFPVTHLREVRDAINDLIMGLGNHGGGTL